MKRKVKILKSWMGHSVGTILEVDEATAATIIKEQAGEIFDDTMDVKIAAATKGIQDAAVKAATDAVEKSIKEMAIGYSKMVHISVKDNSDDDPTFGYLPGSNKSLKDLSKDEINYAFGRFAVDVQKSAQGGREPEALMKCRERSDKLITKAAGDGMIVGSDEAGGYLIFAAAAQLIQNNTLENSIVRPRASRVTMATQLLRIPYLRDLDHSTGTVFGGISIYFQDENAAGTEGRPKMDMLEFKLKKMTAMGYASEEWIRWSPVSLGSWLIPKFGEAVGWKEDLCFLGGKGASQPLGLLKAPCAISQAGETGQDTKTFVLENSTAMFARLRIKKLSSVAWVMNQTVFPQLPLFNITAGTGGAPVFVNQMNGGVQNAPGQSLWGFPIIWTEKVPALGTAGCVSLVDFSDYQIADDQSGPEIAQSIHLKFDLGQTAFRMVKYIDGQNESVSALTPVYGNTMSPVVSLAAI